MIFIWFLLSVLLASIGFLIGFPHGFLALVPACFVAIVTFGIICSEISEHSNDLGVVRAYDGVVHAYQQQLSDMREVLKEEFGIVKTDVTVLLNADSPVSSVVDSIKRATNSIAEARSHVARAKVSIASRKAGMFWFIVSAYGEQ